MTVTISCPSCGKESAESEESCSRCRCELLVLFQIKSQAEHTQKQAALDLREKRFIDCLQNCEQSWSSFPSEETTELAFIAAVLQGDAFLVMKWKCRIDRLGN